MGEMSHLDEIDRVHAERCEAGGEAAAEVRPDGFGHRWSAAGENGARSLARVEQGGLGQCRAAGEPSRVTGQPPGTAGHLEWNDSARGGSDLWAFFALGGRGC